MYEPDFQPQLVKGVPTASDDCGVRATSMGIDWATEGVKTPPVPSLRKRMVKSLTGPTNTIDWEVAIESYDTPKELGDKFKTLKCRRLAGAAWSEVIQHLREGKAVILAVDYGVLYKLAPGKCGSTTFKDSHAILFLGIKSSGEYIKSFDDLNDRRRRGIPQGPLWVATEAVKQAALAYGRQNNATQGVFGVLIEPGVPVKPTAPTPPPVVDETPTLAEVLSDLYNLRADVPAVRPIIADLEALIGPYTAPLPDAEPTAGVKK